MMDAELREIVAFPEDGNLFFNFFMKYSLKPVQTDCQIIITVKRSEIPSNLWKFKIKKWILFFKKSGIKVWTEDK